MLLLKAEILQPLFGFTLGKSMAFRSRFPDVLSFPAQLLLKIVQEHFRLHRGGFSCLCGLSQSPVTADNHQTFRSRACFYFFLDDRIGISSDTGKNNLQIADIVKSTFVSRPCTVKNQLTGLAGQFQKPAHNSTQLDFSNRLGIFLGLMDCVQ